MAWNKNDQCHNLQFDNMAWKFESTQRHWSRNYLFEGFDKPEEIGFYFILIFQKGHIKNDKIKILKR